MNDKLVDVLIAHSQIEDAFIALSDAEKNLVEVAATMTSVNKLTQLIKDCGFTDESCDLIRNNKEIGKFTTLSIDKLIKYKSTEGLIEGAKVAIQKFVEAVRAFWKKVVAFFTVSVPERYRAIILKMKKMSTETRATESLGMRMVQRLDPVKKSDIEKAITHFIRVCDNGKNISIKITKYHKSVLDGLHNSDQYGAVDKIVNDEIFDSDQDWFESCTKNFDSSTIPEIPLADKDEILKKISAMYDSDQTYKNLVEIDSQLKEQQRITETFLKNLQDFVDPDKAQYRYKVIEKHLRQINRFTSRFVMSIGRAIQYTDRLSVVLDRAR